MGAAGVRHLPKELLHLKGLRGCALGVEDLIPDHILIGADEPHLGPGGVFQDILQEIGGGGLAVGAGDAHHGHLPGRVVEEIGPHHSQGSAAVFHLDIGNVPLRRRLAQNAHCPPLHRSRDILVAVGSKAGHGDEQVPGLGLPGVVADAGNLHLQIR